MIVVEGKQSLHIAAAAWLVEENRELAWAEKHVVHNPAYAWILGNYVGANKANDNGHIFDSTELAAASQSLLYAPMNMLHRPQAVMGVFVANEVIWPTDTTHSAAVAAGRAGTETEPYLEALAAFYRYYFPDEYALVKKSHDEGNLAWSMECVPETVTCAATTGCGKTFAYEGRQSPSYCPHLNEPAAQKRMGKPHFTAGALVVPPARPAWRNATVTELSVLVRQELEAAESLYGQAKAEFPHLSPTEWEALMGQLLVSVEKSDRAAGNPFAKGKPAAKPGKPAGKTHPYSPKGTEFNAPCKVCGKKRFDPVHSKPAKSTGRPLLPSIRLK